MPQATLNIVPYSDRYQAAVWQLHETSIQGGGYQSLNPDIFADLKNIPTAYQTNGAFLLGLIDEELITMGGYYQYEKPLEAKLMRMRTHPNHQNKGYAIQLLEQLEISAAARGYKTMVLGSLKDEKAAQAFYERRGYAYTGDRIIKGLLAAYYEKSLA